MVVALDTYRRQDLALAFSPPGSDYSDISPSTLFSFDLQAPACDFYDSSSAITDDDLQLPLEYFMPTSQTNPEIRVQQPSPGVVAQPHTHQPQFWHQLASGQRPASFAGHQRRRLQGQHSSHKRHSSGSSIASPGPASPFTPTTSYPHIIDPESQLYSPSALETFDQSAHASAAYSKPLSNAPRPTFTDTFHSLPDFQEYYPVPDSTDAGAVLQLAWRPMMAQQQELGPAEAVGVAGGDYDPPARMPGYPRLSRTISEICQDELYTPSIQSAGPSRQRQMDPSPAMKQTHLSPHQRDVFSERLQAANSGHISARSTSPATATSGSRSPFQATSRYLGEEFALDRDAAHRPSAAAAEMRERQEAHDDATAFANHDPSKYATQRAPPKTISPKEAVLHGFDEPAESLGMAPLFPRRNPATSASDSGNQFSDSMIAQDLSHNANATLSTQPGFSSMATTKRENSSIPSIPAAAAQPRSGPGGVPRQAAQGNQQYPFLELRRQQNSSMQSATDPPPEFPASLPSMESTKSENGAKSPQDQPNGQQEAQRPASTTADTGTYTCTYHGCTLRFETPFKLQKHKRDGHRQATPQNAAGGATSAGMANRNSQAGPHRCDRINPSTGKPCHSLFSRPYDLTRHEDTIHNSRKQKVRCQFCTEEKTFSRNDALTRHMRVVHPEVDFPGKHKGKGRS
jgi:26S proteasome regulatory subunit N4